MSVDLADLIARRQRQGERAQPGTHEWRERTERHLADWLGLLEVADTDAERAYILHTIGNLHQHLADCYLDKARQAEDRSARIAAENQAKLAPLAVGDLAKHPTKGYGRIVQLSSEGPEAFVAWGPGGRSWVKLHRLSRA